MLPADSISERLALAMNGESVLASGSDDDGRVRVHRQGMQHKYNSADDQLLELPDGGGGGGDGSDVHRERSPSRQHHHHYHHKHRSFSSPRTADGGSSSSRSANKPSKKPKHYLGTANTSLTSIPNAIKLSMLNSGLLSVGERSVVFSTPPLFLSFSLCRLGRDADCNNDDVTSVLFWQRPKNRERNR